MKWTPGDRSNIEDRRGSSGMGMRAGGLGIGGLLVVLLLALITQIAIAAVHLEKPRPQSAALLIFTVAAVSILGLLAVHEEPFEPPVFVPPGPIADVLKVVPK